MILVYNDILVLYIIKYMIIYKYSIQLHISTVYNLVVSLLTNECVKSESPCKMPLVILTSARFGLVWFGGFYGISTFVGYLTPNPLLCK